VKKGGKFSEGIHSCIEIQMPTTIPTTPQTIAERMNP
jgi:hypothetical protein